MKAGIGKERGGEWEVERGGGRGSVFGVRNGVRNGRGALRVNIDLKVEETIKETGRQDCIGVNEWMTEKGREGGGRRVNEARE